MVGNLQQGTMVLQEAQDHPLFPSAYAGQDC